MHPYYMNNIIWMEYVKPPSLDDVQHAWEILLNEERGDTQKELSLLPIGQKKVLSVLAQGITTNLTSRAISTKIDISSSSIAAALNALEGKDVLEQKESGAYHIVNPMLAAFIDAEEQE